MSMTELDASFLEGLPGPVRLFPLPNLVLFPHCVQPLHIFEPRYCEMLQDALAGDRLIATVLLESGWEREYERRAAIAPVACLARVVSHQRTADGKHNILLHGLKRAAIRREHPTTRAFRQAEVDLLDDFYPASGAARRGASQRRLVDLARKLLPDTAALQEQLDQLLASQLSLGMLTDIFAYTLGFHLKLKQRLLTHWNVDRRAALLSEKLEILVRSVHREEVLREPEFPPPFSLN
jgi:ATP-dependent Lon protease